MKKTLIKLISVFLGISVLSPMANVYALTDIGESKYKSDIELTVGLGVMSVNDDGLFEPEETITRAEMASVLKNIYDGDSDDDGANKVFDFFGRDVETLISPDENVSTSAERFTDVTGSNERYGDIMLASTYGVMIGTAENTFEPDRKLTVKEAQKIFVDLLGYRIFANLNGGYPNGYILQANKLGLSVNRPGDSKITRAELAHLFAKAAEDVSPVTAEYNGEGMTYGKDKDANLLNTFMNIEKVSGVIVDNGITSLTGNSTIGENRIKIRDDKNTEYILSFDSSKRGIVDLIGQRADCYLGNENSKRQDEVIFARVNAKNKSLTILMSDIENAESFSGREVEYSLGSSVKTAKIKDGAYFIVNGKAVTVLPNDKSHMLDYDNGTVTLISSDSGSVYDTVVIEAFENWAVDSVDSKNGYIYNKNADSILNNGDEFLCYDENKNIKCIVINEKGEYTEPESIGKGAAIDVARSDDGTFVKILLSNVTVGEFTVLSYDRSKRIISDRKNEYKVSKYFLNSKKGQGCKTGAKYKLYLNSFGEVTWMEATESTWQIGYAKAIKYSYDDDYAFVKVLNGDKSFKNYIFAEKVRITDSYDKNSKIKPEEAEKLRFTRGVIRYKLNSDDFVTDIEFPLDQSIKSKSDDRLYVLVDSNEDGKSYQYSQQLKTLGGKFFMDDKITKMISIPKDADSDDYAFADVNNLWSGRSYKATAYGTNYKSPVADVVLFDDIYSDKSNFYDTDPAYVVTEIVQECNADNDVVNSLTVVNVNGQKSVLYDRMENDLVHNAVKITADAKNLSARDRCTVEIGDIIRLKTDSQGYVTYVEVIFDANGKYDNRIYSDTFEDVDTSFSHVKNGTLAGTIGYFSDKIQNTNPWGGVKGINKTNNNYGKEYMGGSPRIIYGYVYDVYDGYVTYTTKDLYAGSDGMDSGRYITETRAIGNSGSVLYVDYTRNKVTAGGGSAESIRSFCESANEFSRIIVCSASTDARWCIVINGEMNK